MTISSQPAASLLDSALRADTTRVDVGVAMLKKAQDMQKQQGVALIDMLEKSVSDEGRPHLDAYA